MTRAEITDGSPSARSACSAAWSALRPGPTSWRSLLN